MTRREFDGDIDFLKAKLEEIRKDGHRRFAAYEKERAATTPK